MTKPGSALPLSVLLAVGVALGASACGPAAAPAPAAPPTAGPPAPVAAPAPPPPATPAPSPAADAWVHRPTGVGFPPTLGGMVRKEITRYPSPGLGESLFYLGRSSGAFATIYLYTMGLGTIADDIRGGAVRGELGRSVAELEATSAAGTYRNLSLQPPRVVVLGSDPSSPPAWHVGCAFELRGEPMLSHLFLTSYRNHFVKVRFSHPAATSAASTRLLHGLLDELGALLRGRGPGR